MFGRFNRCFNPYRRWLGLALIALGVILMLIFVPFEIWLCLLGLLLLVVGCLLLRC